MIRTRLKLDQAGILNALLLPFIITVMLLIGLGAFAFWAFSGRQDYKNNVDQKIAVAVDTAVKANSAKKDAQFAEDSKSPLKTYNGPSDYGSIVVQYPKTWSAYINETPGSSDIDGYFDPNFVPNLTDANSLFSLRLQVLNVDYGGALQAYANFVKTGQVAAKPYALPKVPSVVGTRLDGKILSNKTGSMILLPLRDKTIKIWTESTASVPDFDTYILPNLSFSP